MPETGFQDLLGRFLDEELSPAELKSLAGFLASNKDCAKAFDSAVHLESLLAVTHCPAPSPARISANIRRRLRGGMRRLLMFTAAASILAAVFGSWMAFRKPDLIPGKPQHTLLSGQVMVNGQPSHSKHIPENSSIENSGNKAALIRLADGSMATLATGSRIILKGSDQKTRQIVELHQGRSSFKVKTEPRQFRVDTPLGRITVLGTEFSVALKVPLQKEQGENKMKTKLAFLLAVAVTAGTVRVDFNGKEDILTAGASKVFGAESEDGPRKEEKPSSLPRKARGFSGRVRGVVTAKQEGKTFSFRVTEVQKTWKGNKARDPKSLIGQTIVIGPRRDKKNRRRPVEIHVLFIKKIPVGQNLTLEVVNRERERFSILELNKECREFALKGAREGEGRKEETRQEEGLKEGQREGDDNKDNALERGKTLVLSKGKASARLIAMVIGRKGPKLLVKIERVNGTLKWKSEKGKEHSAKTGSKITFCAQWEKREGKWRPSNHEMKMLSKLRRGDRIECGVYFDNHPRLRSFSLMARTGKKEDTPRKEGDKPEEKEENPVKETEVEDEDLNF